MNIKKSVMKTIEEKKVKPISKWHFFWREYVLWFSVGLFLIIGGISVALILHIMRTSDWDVYEHITDNIFSFTLLVLPYFWLFALLCFLVIFHFGIRKTKRGYRHSPLFLFSFSIGGSILLGIIFFSIGLGNVLNSTFSERIPGYNKIVFKKVQFWSQPDQGLIAGVIISGNNKDHFIIKDMGNNEWKILVASSTDILDDVISIGKKARVIGELSKDHTFVAKKVLPWRPKHINFRASKKHKSETKFYKERIK